MTHDEPTTLGGDGDWRKARRPWHDPGINLTLTPVYRRTRGERLLTVAIHTASAACVILAAYLIWRLV